MWLFFNKSRGAERDQCRIWCRPAELPRAGWSGPQVVKTRPTRPGLGHDAPDVRRVPKVQVAPPAGLPTVRPSRYTTTPFNRHANGVRAPGYTSWRRPVRPPRQRRVRPGVHVLESSPTRQPVLCGAGSR